MEAEVPLQQAPEGVAPSQPSAHVPEEVLQSQSHANVQEDVPSKQPSVPISEEVPLNRPSDKVPGDRSEKVLPVPLPFPHLQLLSFDG